MSHAMTRNDTPHDATQKKGPKRRAIGRKKLRQEEAKEETEEVRSVTAKSKSPEQTTDAKEGIGGYPHDLSVRINALLYEVVDDFVISANTGGDYRYTSTADFIRAALHDHKEGKKLETRAESGQKKRMTLRVDDGLKAHYEGLPRGKRTEILERAIRTKLLS